MNRMKTLEQLMTKHPLTIAENDSLQKASDLMLQRRIRHLPVTDSKGDVIGILSDRDIQRAMVVRSVAGGTEIVLSPHRKVREFMSWPPHTVDLSTPITQVLQILIKEKISALLVESELSGKIRGIITSEDLLMEFEQMIRQTSSETDVGLLDL
ncbi:MAG: CBS domain-containing protein [Bdellovibrionales bacterium]|nr:CBS domain-containing protein [Bdellovibrionales bacterium]